MSILTETQCRTARALLNWSQAELAKRSNLSESTIRDFEKRRRIPAANNLHAVVNAFRDAGVILLDDGQTSGVGGEGVRFAEDASGKKLENERQQLEQELISARSVMNFLVEQISTSAEMKNNMSFRRLLSQAEQEVQLLQFRMGEIEARLRMDRAGARYFAERAEMLISDPPEEPHDL